MVKIRAKKVSLIISIAMILAFSLSTLVSANFATITDVEGSMIREEGNPPSHIMDDDEFTRWGNIQPWDDVVITLSQPETVTSIDMMWFRGNERMYHFEIESSTDGSTWTAVAMDNDTTSGDPALQPADFPDAAVTGFWENFALTTPVTAQYWRMTYLGRYETGTLASAVGSLWNIRFVTGDAPAATPTPPPADPTPVADPTPPPADPAPVATPAAPTPAQTAPAAAPQTFDPITLIAVGAIASAAGVVIAKKRKEK